MSELVATVGVQHNPLLWRVLADPHDDDLVALRDAFRETSARLLATRPDVLVIFATDHLTQWFYDNMPTFLIGKAPVVRTTFPNEEREFGLPERTLAGDVDLATWLLNDGITRGVDFASSDEYRADHSVLVPLHYLTPDLDIPIVPIFTNCIAPPLPPAERLYAVGQAVRASIDKCPLHRRIAVLASGHLATEVGGPKHFRGSPDLDFEAEAVDMVRNGRLGDLDKLATFDRLRDAGNVSHQFLNFVAAMGVVGGRPATHAKAMYSRFATSPFFEWYADDLG
jgi:protocatechuate 4,5-dioxygenase beta chain